MTICEDIAKIIKNNLKDILAFRNKKVLKPDNSYVSEGDLLCERLIKEYIAEHHPQYAIISEESPEDNVNNIDKPYLVIIDPIDGTENFVSGLKEWGVAVCIYHNGQHQQSMLAMPELDGYIISGHQLERFESRIAGISSSLTKEDLMKLVPGFEYRIIGCCVYNMYNVVKGSYATFENPKGAYVWDIIPGLNLALENGLHVTINNQEYHGELLRPDQKYIFKIWQK